MRKLKISSPLLLKKVDELTVFSHPYLESNDEIYYMQEYTIGKGANFNDTNQLIFNYKKEQKWKGHSSYEYKEKAIQEIAKRWSFLISNTFGFLRRAKNALLVPIPPHAAKDDLEYDDRNLKMLRALFPNGNIHELILQKKSRNPLHSKKAKRRLPQELTNNYLIDNSNLKKEFEEIWLFDDILRSGTHFRAAHDMITSYFPAIKVAGFFVARAICHDDC